jgi:predicted ferric reductase
MGKVVWRAGLWGAAYLLLASAPLGLALLGSAPAGRGFLIELGVALGLVGFGLLGLQFVTTARFRWVAPYLGTDATIQFHRETGILALLFVLAHPTLLILVHREYLEFFDPRVNLLRAVFLAAATAGTILLVVTSLWRSSFRLSYERWRLAHAVMGFGVVLVGLVHALQVGHYISGPVKQGGWVLAAALPIGLLLHTRLYKPWKSRRRPYRLMGVRQDVPEVFTLLLEADGHPGLRFSAGQYAWFTVGKTPFALQQHPFTIASSDADPTRLELGVKELGDFTASTMNMHMRTPVFVEGPYGSFSLDPQAQGAVFVIGGIGVTPALSMLRSCRDREDGRPFLLIYANNRWHEVPFRKELDELSGQLDLEIVHVLAEPGGDWQGETGFLTAEILERHLASRRHLDLQYFVCGPPPMMELVEKELRRQGVPLKRLHSELFDLV